MTENTRERTSSTERIEVIWQSNMHNCILPVSDGVIMPPVWCFILNISVPLQRSLKKDALKGSK